jgi:hypothetical protein
VVKQLLGFLRNGLQLKINGVTTGIGLLIRTEKVTAPNLIFINNCSVEALLPFQNVTLTITTGNIGIGTIP